MPHTESPACTARRTSIDPRADLVRPDETRGPARAGIGRARPLVRCPWARGELYVAYHDREWGVPLRDDRALFELLVLDGAQAGLSWLTILRKREGYRRAFAGFDPEKLARFDARQVEHLLADPAIVRNRLKIEAAIGNARAFLAVRDEVGSFSDFLWAIAGGRPQQNRWHSMSEVPTRTAVSDAMSRELRRRGFRFVGSTICYAFMQSAGMVNDHLVSCFRHREVKRFPAAR